MTGQTWPPDRYLPDKNEHDHSPDKPHKAVDVEVIEGETFVLRIHPKHDDFEPFDWDASEYVALWPEIRDVFDEVTVSDDGRCIQWKIDSEPRQKFVTDLYCKATGQDESYYPAGVEEPPDQPDNILRVRFGRMNDDEAD